MSSEMWVALISGVLTLFGVIITNIYGNKKNTKDNTKTRDLTLYRMEQLEKKVDLHNNAVERLFKAEGQIVEIQHDIRDLKRKIK